MSKPYRYHEPVDMKVSRCSFCGTPWVDGAPDSNSPIATHFPHTALNELVLQLRDVWSEGDFTDGDIVDIVADVLRSYGIEVSNVR